MKKVNLFFFILISLFLLLSFVSICTGSVKISLSDTISGLLGKGDESTVFIVRNMRLPRTCTAILAGSCLACCGLIFQSIFRNQMADSYVLGISSAASCAVAVSVASGLNIAMNTGFSVFSFAGSLLCCLLLYFSGKKNPYSVLLTGIAVNFLLSALTTLFIYLSGKNSESILFWTMGSLENTGLKQNLVLFFVTVLIAFISFKDSDSLDLMLFDDSTALSSGLDIKTKKMVFMILGCLSTSITVSYCGVIGFIGLMSPHLARTVNGPAHKNLIVLSMLTGSDILLLSDIISRTVISPSQLPVGIVTSIIGAPIFLIMFKRKDRWN